MVDNIEKENEEVYTDLSRNTVFTDPATVNFGYKDFLRINPGKIIFTCVILLFLLLEFVHKLLFYFD